MINLSIRKNTGKIFNTDSEANNLQLTSLHAIRFLSLAWVIIGIYYFILFEITTCKPVNQLIIKKINLLRS
jgi:hypothetical protein